MPKYLRGLKSPCRVSSPPYRGMGCPHLPEFFDERLSVLLNEAEHLTGAPELIVEVLSPGAENERRDREVKLKLYASQGVQEYWIADRRLQQVQVYRRQAAILKLVATLLAGDEISSPLLPGFTCSVVLFFR